MAAVMGGATLTAAAVMLLVVRPRQAAVAELPLAATA
jgi:hypothetical protein